MTARRFPPPPWSVEEQSACFVVRDRNGQVLAHVYFEDESGRRPAAELLPKMRRDGLQRNLPGCRSYFTQSLLILILSIARETRGKRSRPRALIAGVGCPRFL
jgi:hypothetical protein